MFTLSTNVTTEEVIIVLTQGGIMALFIFAPFIYILRREFDKFYSNEVTEHQQGRSVYTFMITSAIILAGASIVYHIVIVLIELSFPDLKPITGETGITRLFWEMDLPTIPQGETTALTVDFLYTQKLLRKFIEVLCVLIVVMSIFLTSMLSWSILGAYQDDSQRGSIIGTSVKIIMSTSISWIVLRYYSESTSWILNYPGDEPIWNIATIWFKDALSNASNVPISSL